MVRRGSFDSSMTIPAAFTLQTLLEATQQFETWRTGVGHLGVARYTVWYTEGGALDIDALGLRVLDCRVRYWEGLGWHS